MRRQRVRKNRTLRILEPVQTPGCIEYNCLEPQQAEPLATPTGTEGQDDTVNILGELRVKECSEKKIGRNLDDLEDVIAEARRMLNQTAGVSRARGGTTRGKPPGEIPGGECPPDGVRTGRGESADGGSRGGDSSGAAENGSSSRFPRRGYAR